MGSLRSSGDSIEVWSLRNDQSEHAFGRCVATLLELLSDDSCFLRNAFRKEESISKNYSSKKVFFVFFFGDLDVNFVETVFDPNKNLQP